MKVNILIGPKAVDTTITDSENGYKFHPTRIELVVDAKTIPMLRMDFEVDDISVEGINISTELGKATLLAGEKWAKENGFKLVPDDNLDVELGRTRDLD